MNEIPGWSYQTVLAAEPVSASKARDFIGEHLVAHGLLHLVEDVRLVTSELTTNAMVHARTPFAVTLAQLDGIVRLTITDGSSSVPVRNTPGLMDMNGRGLMLVGLLSDAWGATTGSDGSKAVWASFATRAMPGPAQVSG
jgi:anti-sigma regulatory factor (Ser/Thr protein kinase)